MTKIVAMIPVRLGSSRVPKKNLRYLAGKPLVAHIIEAAKASGVFDAIYLNSEAEIFADIARDYGISFYKRPGALASDSATNDDFALDFVENVESEYLIQLLCTSPFLNADQIRGFTQHMLESELDTLVSTRDEQIECIYKGAPINFEMLTQTQPSQTLEPIKAYACSIMGWRTDTYKRNMARHNTAYHGGDGKTGYYSIKGYATIDIDREEDFEIAEVVAEFLSRGTTSRLPRYYGDAKERRERDVQSILQKDGVAHNDLDQSNQPVVNVPAIIEANKDQSSWSRRLVDTENNSMTLICQRAGGGNRRHYHSNWNEWWYIVQGAWEWELEGETLKVQQGDVVFIPKGKWHKITAVGDVPSIRMAVSRADVDHIYEETSNAV